MAKVTFDREQVSEMNEYQATTVTLPDNGMPFTVRDLVEKLAAGYDLPYDSHSKTCEGMIFLNHGHPITLDTVLKDGDYIFGKGSLKSRGFRVKA